MNMDDNRKFWNAQQKELQAILSRPEEHHRAIQLFLQQHAMVHSGSMSRSNLHSFEDEVCQGLSGQAFRIIPPGMEHSIVWILWHLARIEDVTMNLLVAGGTQVFFDQNWDRQIGAPIHDSGNAIRQQGVLALSLAVHVEILRAYRVAVGCRTREIVRHLSSGQLKQKVDPGRLLKVKGEGGVIHAAEEVITYWSRRTIAGLLLMPPTRHNFLHLNEAARVKAKIIKRK
jgi:hypothetical protein